ncbi:MAG: amidohydrolase family protein [Armatimonadota bacterium]
MASALDSGALRQQLGELQSPAEALRGVLVIDCHGHIGPHAGYYGPDDDVRGIIAAMDLVGVNMLCVNALCALEGDYRAGNEMTAAAVRQHPDRLIGHGCINPNYPEDMEAELARCFEELGLRIMKFHCGWHGKPADDPAYRPAVEYAAARGLPLLAHLHDYAGGAKGYAELAKQFPDMAFLLAHASEPNAMPTVIEHCGPVENVHFDITGYPMHRQAIENLVNAVGADRVLFGSDIAWLNLPYELGAVLYAKISDEDREKILGLNMARILRLESPQT